MSMLDKLKQKGRVLTGGSAQVHVEVQEATVNDPFSVKVKASIADADVKIDAVYVLVKAYEEMRWDYDRIQSRLGDERLGDLTDQARVGVVEDKEETCDIRVNISGPQELAANNEYEWDGEVAVPAGSAPSYHGKSCDHSWQIQAGLDAFGNDPDSGWIEFEMG